MQRGFSFIELVVVLSILAIMAAIAVPRVGDSVAVRELEDAAQQLATDIRWTQQAVVNADQNDLPRLVFVNAKPYGYLVTQGGGTIRKNTFPDSVEMTGNPGTVAYKANGLPVGGSDLTFWLKSTIVSESRKVIIAWSTGRVRVEAVK
jgi:prepilin-type N-terminal cleavage/methylation domain-containing protein